MLWKWKRKDMELEDSKYGMVLSNLKYEPNRRAFVRQIRKIHKQEGAAGVARFLEVQEKDLDFVKKQLGILNIGLDASTEVPRFRSTPPADSPGELLAYVKYLLNFVRAIFKEKTVHLPPGTQLDRLAEFLASPKIYQRGLRPTIADMQSEYASALASGRVWKARWIRVIGYWTFWKTWGIFSSVNFACSLLRLTFLGRAK